MPIISLINEKGGAGKSTTSLHFAFWLYAKKKKVQIVDSDPQRSCSKWLSAIGNPIPVNI
ncbi:MAG: ParA family protein, partial [Nostoc sp.]|uniref:ParA family protein n=1 Tax=Nostoc sp. TaxID=1180 RepID=UPI002FF4F3A3